MAGDEIYMKNLELEQTRGRCDTPRDRGCGEARANQQTMEGGKVTRKTTSAVARKLFYWEVERVPTAEYGGAGRGGDKADTRQAENGPVP